MTDGPTSDISVRQAMSYSVNRDELSKTFYKGLATPGGRWFMHEQTWGWDPSFAADPYDLAKAKQLLADAGYPGKFKNPVIQINTQSDARLEMMQAVQGYWDKAGIQTKINIVDAMTYGGLYFVRAKDASAPNVGDIIPWVSGGFFNNVYHSANMFTSVGVHTTANDPKADQLYAKAIAEIDPVKAKQYWTEFTAYAYTLWVNVGIIKRPTLFAVGPNVGEFTAKAHLGIYDSLAGIQHKK